NCHTWLGLDRNCVGDWITCNNAGASARQLGRELIGVNAALNCDRDIGRRGRRSGRQRDERSQRCRDESAAQPADPCGRSIHSTKHAVLQTSMSVWNYQPSPTSESIAKVGSAKCFWPNAP